MRCVRRTFRRSSPGAACSRAAAARRSSRPTSSARSRSGQASSSAPARAWIELRDIDIAVIGGGLMGSAIAWGLARAGQRVTVLDEGDIAYRASRGNFALIWVQSKGLGLAPYSIWTLRSSNAWAGFADMLREQTGIDVCFQRPGGYNLSLSEI